VAPVSASGSPVERPEALWHTPGRTLP